MTEVGFRVTLATPVGRIVRSTDWVEAPNTAVIVELVWAVTKAVLIVNVALNCPAKIATLAGSEAAVMELVREITAPPFGAGPFNSTDPVDEFPPVTEPGSNVKLETLSGAIVRLAVRVEVLVDAVIVVVAEELTAEVLTVN